MILGNRSKTLSYSKDLTLFKTKWRIFDFILKIIKFETILINDLNIIDPNRYIPTY